MTAEQIIEILKERFGDTIIESKCETAHPHAVVAPQAWHDVAVFLKTDPRLRFDLLRCVTGVDMLEDNQLVAVYDLYSMQPGREPRANWSARHDFCVKVRLSRGDPRLASVADVWPAADWLERETYDLVGIVFENHPDSVEGPEGVHPRRVLCPDDWEGHPLRKDYDFPMEYHGIPAVTEYGQTRPVH